MTQDEARQQAKELYEAGEIEVNGRIYEMLTMRHQKRLEVFAFYSEHGQMIAKGNFSSFVGQHFNHISKIMFDAITFEGNQLSKLPDHWDEYPEDFLQVVGTSMGVMSYPFIRGSNTGSQSQGATKQKTTSKKQISAQ